jgi:hypothetical protein
MDSPGTASTTILEVASHLIPTLEIHIAIVRDLLVESSLFNDPAEDRYR